MSDQQNPSGNNNAILQFIAAYLASMQTSPTARGQQNINATLDAANQARQNYAATPGSTAASMGMQREAENGWLRKLLTAGDYNALHRDAYGNVSPYDVLGDMQQEEKTGAAFQQALNNWKQQHANMSGASSPELLKPKWLEPDPNIPTYMSQRALDWRIAHPQTGDLTGPGGEITPQELSNWRRYLPHTGGTSIPGSGPASSVGGLA